MSARRHLCLEAFVTLLFLFLTVYTFTFPRQAKLEEERRQQREKEEEEARQRRLLEEQRARQREEEEREAQARLRAAQEKAQEEERRRRLEEEEERKRREEERRLEEEERVRKEEERKRKDEEVKERRKKLDRGRPLQKAPKLAVYRALYSFQARNSDELSIDANCLIEVQANRTLVILKNMSVILLNINTCLKVCYVLSVCDIPWLQGGPVLLDAGG